MHEKLKGAFLSRMLRSVFRLGLVRTGQSGLSVVEDLLFDWHNHTDTVGRMLQSELKYAHRNKASALAYVPEAVLSRKSWPP
jgi:hypothetical protein